MKILNIYFKNINSLEGESRIHFDQAPITDRGIFAITGPNGSGKSSILDAITLGLYGETNRFDRPADHVMTKMTAESFSQVEFILRDEKFRSSWHVRREGGDSEGELLTPEMKLIQLNGSEQVLEESAQKVRDRMAELTGMDFHKFSKSMILAQGDFAAFLNALDSERMDILEKISGADIYAEYQKQAEEKNTQAKTQLQQLEQDLNAIPVMDAVTIEAKQEDLADFQQQQVDFTYELNEVQQQLVQAQNIAELENQLKTLSDKQQQVERQLEQNQHTLDQIDATQDLIGFEDDLTTIDNKLDNIDQSKNTLNSYRSELEILQKQLKSTDLDESSEVSEKTLDQLKNSIDQSKLKVSELKYDLSTENALFQSLNQQMNEKKSVLNTTENWLQEHTMDKNLLENFPETEKLKSLRAELAELEEKRKAYTKQAKNTTDALQNKKENIAGQNEKIVNLKAEIEADEKSLEMMVKGNSLLDLQKMKVEHQERVENIQELYNLAKVKDKLGKPGLFGFPFLQANNEQIDEKLLVEEADRLQLEIEREQNIVQTLELAVSNETLLQKMQSDREHLVDGKPCPLCGALQHPYLKHPPAVSTSKPVLTAQKKKVKALIAESKALAKQITATKKQTEKDRKKDAQLQEVYSKWNSLANRLNTGSMDLDIDDPSLMKDILNTEKQELNDINSLLKNYTKLQSSVTQAKSSIEANEASLRRLAIEIKELEAEKNSPSQELINLDKAYIKCQEQEQAFAVTVLEQLNRLGEKMPDKGNEDALFSSLDNRKQKFQTQVLRQQTLTEEIQALAAKITSCSTKIDEINHDIQQCSAQAQKEESAGLHLSLIEKQKLIVEKEKQLSQLEVELASLKQNLSDKTRDTEQGDLNVLKETIALAKRQPEFQQKKLELTQSITNIQDNIDKIQSQLEVEQATEAIKKTEEELETQQKSIIEKLDIAKLEVESLQSKLSQQSDLQEQYEDFHAKIVSQKAVVEACEADIQLINDANGVHFRRKVQQIMSDKLLSQANQVLEKISGRYYVRKVDSDHGLALEIEDTKQHNVRRSPKTLSGGEGFIVSLALALGLAEMANSGHAIDSLFLDEGFGNLDAESLYAAMMTLEGLKTHGKVVGIISHVEGVRKRIKTQIEMIKKPNGLSALKRVS